MGECCGVGDGDGDDNGNAVDETTTYCHHYESERERETRLLARSLASVSIKRSLLLSFTVVGSCLLSFFAPSIVLLRLIRLSRSRPLHSCCWHARHLIHPFFSSF